MCADRIARRVVEDGAWFISATEISRSFPSLRRSASLPRTGVQRPHRRRHVDSVEASLNFHRDTEGPPHFYTYQPPIGVPRVRGGREQRVVRVRNGWRLPDTTLDIHGFHAGTYPTYFTDWTNPRAVVRDYYPEAASYLLEITGATRVMVFDHNVRSNMKADDHTWANTSDYARTANWVHNDYTVRSAPKRAAELLGEAPSVRFAYVNLWRPIVSPLRDAPLAVCDGRTIFPGDVESAKLIYPTRGGEYYLLRHNPLQEWYFFPEMRTDEALFLKCMDSVTDGRTRFSAHTSFDDPTVPVGAPPRESIEARGLVLWE